MPTARGVFSTRVKSSTVSVMPMPSIMTASPQVMNPPLNQVNQAGCASASAPQASTQTGNRFVARAGMRFMRGLNEFPNQAQSHFSRGRRPGCRRIQSVAEAGSNAAKTLPR